MIRSAAKNHERVAVSSIRPTTRRVLAEIDAAGEVSAATRFRLARKAFAHTAAYDGAIASHLGRLDDARRRRSPISRRRCTSRGDAGARAALRREPAPEGGLLRASTARRARRWRAPRCCRARSCRTTTCSISTRRCGSAPSSRSRRRRSSSTTTRAAPRSRAGRRRGGLPPRARDRSGVGVRRHRGGQPPGRRRARRASCRETFLECVIAPAFAPEALALLAAKKNLRLLACEIGRDAAGRRSSCAASRAASWSRRAIATPRPRPTRKVRLEAPADRRTSCAISTSPGASASTSSRTPSCSRRAAGRWASAPARCRASTRSASPSRRRARRWPARWSPPTRSSRSATASTRRPRRARVAVIQPGGSVRDAESIAAADEHGMAMVLTGERHFRH